ncbi:3-isopropylmalate dehydrogenase [Tumebacillus sp. DT12]|uniref:3-isopropylmalate dehydrogenase n=1 Tax=Tumebacillus lacus TaxID=2995335 RepID=A0ABT3XA65_9BACL|nr:3-isopropylmalate dehydrogenase [Tumebacillus lacus]MCX7571639.1 3-isopropylmalate dehydrogenase [Tumebacillus lacus]
MKSIALLPGDGIGPEVIAEAKKVLAAVGAAYGREMTFESYPFGGAGIDECGDPYPEVTAAGIRRSSAILLGAVGGPRWDALPLEQRPERGILRLRADLDVYANLRPVRVHDVLLSYCPLRPELAKGTDLVIVRELTAGIYYGERGRSRANGEWQAYDTCTYTASQIERVVRAGFETAQKRRKILHSVDKANVMTTSGLWREIVGDLAPEYPDVKVHHLLIDNAAMQMMRSPSQFDVLVTENLFGDILSDEASMLAGSIGMIPSASLGPDVSLYEPIHGSAPDIAGLGLSNPIGTILSAAMMLRHSFGWEAEADAVEAAVFRVLEEGYRTRDMTKVGTEAVTTSEMGSLVAEEVLKMSAKVAG